MNPSAMFAWESIATASFAETRKAAVRARKLGKLHKDSISKPGLFHNAIGSMEVTMEVKWNIFEYCKVN
jgi:hypothetical protein